MGIESRLSSRKRKMKRVMTHAMKPEATPIIAATRTSDG